MSFSLQLKSKVAQRLWDLDMFDWIAHRRLKERGMILTYHRVIGNVEEERIFVQPGMYVSTETFRQQMALLQSKFRVLPLAEMVDRIESGRSVGGCCAITFDDGWLDNFTEAFPILQQLQIPVTLFVASSYVGTDKLFWPEEVALCLANLVSCAPTVREQVLVELGLLTSGANNMDQAIASIKRTSHQERQELMHQLRERVPCSPAPRLLMNWDEANLMQASGLVTIGSHTANHVILDQVPEHEAQREILRSCHDIEQHTGKTPWSFAYPNGNYNDAALAALRHNKVRCAVTTSTGFVHQKTSLLEVPRIGVHEDVSRTLPLFLLRILLNYR